MIDWSSPEQIARSELNAEQVEFMRTTVVEIKKRGRWDPSCNSVYKSQLANFFVDTSSSDISKDSGRWRFRTRTLFSCAALRS
jgi:hypothetical protein